MGGWVWERRGFKARGRGEGGGRTGADALGGLAEAGADDGLKVKRGEERLGLRVLHPPGEVGEGGGAGGGRRGRRGFGACTGGGAKRALVEAERGLGRRGRRRARAPVVLQGEAARADDLGLQKVRRGLRGAAGWGRGRAARERRWRAERGGCEASDRRWKRGRGARLGGRRVLPEEVEALELPLCGSIALRQEGGVRSVRAEHGAREERRGTARRLGSRRPPPRAAGDSHLRRLSGIRRRAGLAVGIAWQHLLWQLEETGQRGAATSVREGLTAGPRAVDHLASDSGSPREVRVLGLQLHPTSWALCRQVQQLEGGDWRDGYGRRGAHAARSAECPLLQEQPRAPAPAADVSRKCLETESGNGALGLNVPVRNNAANRSESARGRRPLHGAGRGVQVGRCLGLTFAPTTPARGALWT